jgi:hypothetical protein
VSTQGRSSSVTAIVTVSRLSGKDAAPRDRPCVPERPAAFPVGAER